MAARRTGGAEIDANDGVDLTRDSKHGQCVARSTGGSGTEHIAAPETADVQALWCARLLLLGPGDRKQQS